MDSLKDDTLREMTTGGIFLQQPLTFSMENETLLAEVSKISKGKVSCVTGMVPN